MLSADAFAALVLFGFVASITPGPNNLMLLASGVNFGLARTVPHMLGIAIGFSLMIVLVGLGFVQLFVLLPWLHPAMKVAGILYMLWLAWRIANAGAVGSGKAAGRPLTFLQAAAFQWVNPKGWMMALTAIATYSDPQQMVAGVLVVAVVFGIVGTPSIAVWALFGVGLRHFLSSPRTVRIFNVTMALLLVASLWPVVADLVPA
jgi:threonine/homoserine/homoserine lactone efflux protein